MKYLRFSGIILLLAVVCVFISCSYRKSPIEPGLNVPDIPEAVVIGNSNRTVLAVYDATIDPVAKTFTVTLSDDRTADYHFPITQRYPDVLTITRYGFTPNFWADIKITHPLPNSGIDAFDPRVIAILPANPGVSMSYPTLIVLANNSVVLNPDGYTKLFDNLSGSIPGNTNPFLAYFKQVEYRRWFSSGTGFTSDTRRWDMDINGFGGPMTFKLVVDVSLNYPDPPQQVIDNAPEPVEIEAKIGEGLTPEGGDTSIEVGLLDWQGLDGIGDVQIEAPGLFTGTKTLSYFSVAPIENKYYFKGTLANENNIAEGDYNLLVKTSDLQTGIAMHNEFKTKVDGHTPSNPIDVTPPWLNFSPKDVFIEGNYAYVAAESNGLHIFDITDPVNPVWINSVITPWQAHKVHVASGYAYVLDDTVGLQVVDIDPPMSAHSVNQLQLANTLRGIHVSGDLAYVGSINNLYIIDIHNPETAYVLNVVSAGDEITDVFTSDGFAFVADRFTGLRIIDVDPPLSAHLEKTIALPYAYNVYVSNGYVYVVGMDGLSGNFCLHIIDIDPLESAYTLNTLPLEIFTNNAGVGIFASDGYVYIATNQQYSPGDLLVIDVDPPDSASLVKTILTTGQASAVHAVNGYAYLADLNALHVINIEPPENAFVVNTLTTTGITNGVYVLGKFIYVTSWHNGLQIFDIETPESPQLLRNVAWLESEPENIYVSDGYAYVTDLSCGLQIIDIDPPESAQIVKTIDEQVRDVFVMGNYAYVTSGSDLLILDVTTPESAYIYKTINVSHDSVYGIYVTGGYAYLTYYGHREMMIVDIDPLESAHIINTVQMYYDSKSIQVSNGFAYAAVGFLGLEIIDVDPPDASRMLKIIDTPGELSNDIHVSRGYAYIADNESGLQIFDIDPVDNASIISSIDTPGLAENVFVLDGYAYVSSAGLRIIKLW